MDKIKIGVFGAWRGNGYINIMEKEERVEVVAICDKNADTLETEEKHKTIPCFKTFEEFMEYGKSVGMNAVFLANYFHQHAPYAIRAMEAGMNVVSECTSASTLKECVELVETVERTGCKYMIAENYPFTAPNLKMAEKARNGELGTLLYAEGEYNHSGNNAYLRELTPTPYHWRAWMPRTYYVTHSMGPLMYMTNTMPKYVSARSVHSDLLYEIREWRHNYDGVAMMFCEMDNGMICRFTGNSAMASDYSRYRVCGDVAMVESGHQLGTDKYRTMYHEHTKPEGKELDSLEVAKQEDLGEIGQRAAQTGHSGGDYWVVQHMIEYFLDGVEPFFNVYVGVAMSATAILGWRSCLNHGENMKVPDFRIKAERDAVRDDDLTPFPDENCQGATLPCAMPYEG